MAAYGICTASFSTFLQKEHQSNNASEVSQNLFTKEVTMNLMIKSLLLGEAFQVFSPNILE